MENKINLEHKAYKYRIYPNQEQKVLFAKTFGCCRFIYNRMLSDKLDYYEKHGASLQTTPAQYKGEFSFLSEVDSLALANAQINLQTAYKNFFIGKGKIGKPKYKSKHKSERKYTTNNQKDSVRIESGKYIKLPKVGLVRIKLHRAIPDDSIIKSVTISQSSSGKYYVSILTEYEINEPKQIVPAQQTTLGLDYSSHDFYVDSNGNKANYPRYYRRLEQKLQREQRKLSRKKLGSKNRNKQRQKVAAIHEKIANQRMDFCHQLSRKIANSYDAVCVEDIHLRGMAGTLKLGKSTNDNGFGMFRTFLKYKLENMGKQLIVIDKWYPSSKMCHECGTINPNLKLKDREWTCSCCKTHLDRDINAAKNIRDVGLNQHLLEIVA